MTVKYVALSNVEEGGYLNIHPFGWGKVVKVYPSHNRQVFKFQPENTYFGQIIIKTFQADSAPKAADQIRLISEFLSQLADAKLCVAKDVIFSQRIVKAGSILVMQTEKPAGESQEALLSKTDATFDLATALIESALHDCYLPLLKLDKGEDPCRLRLGLDFLPRNLASEKEESQWQTTIVDLVPPKTIGSKGEHRLEWPEPTDPIIRKLGIFRHYNAAGLLIAYWCQLAKIRPEWGRESLRVIRNFLQRNGKDYVAKGIKEYFSQVNLRVHRYSPDKIRQLIADWDIDQILRIRIMGCYIGISRQNSLVEVKKLLAILFAASHFQSDPSDIDLEKSKKCVIQLAALT